MRVFRLLIWDVLFYIIPTIGYAASSVLGSSAANAVIILLVCIVSGAFLSQLSRWGNSWVETVFITVPAVYLTLAPYIASPLNALPLSFDLVPAILLTERATLLRQSAALVTGFTIWQHIFITIPRR